MGQTNIKKTAVSGLIWQMIGRIGVNGVQFLIYVILARLLAPEDFGIIALATAFVAVSNLLVNSGLGTALVQSKRVDETDYSSVFYFSFFLSCVLYMILFTMAPLIARFYDKPIMVGVLRVYAISIIFFAINGVQRSILLREMKFKKIFLVSTIPVLISGVISIVMAILGFGIYALVFNSVASGLFSVVVFWIIVRWKPRLLFSRNRLRELFAFSYKLLLANFLEIGYKNLYPLVIGKAFNSTLLGYYNYGRQVPNFIASTINASITSVVFPIYSRSQSDKKKLKSMVRQSITLSNFVIFPIMAGLAAVAKALVIVILTEKWLPSVPHIQLFCIVYGLHHLQNINFQAISAIGRSDVFLRYEIIKKIIGITLLIFTLPFGIFALVIGQVIAAVISVIINFKPNIIWLNYSATEQIRDFLPYLIISVLMFGGVRIVSLLGVGALVMLILQVIVGIGIYVGMALLFKLKGVQSVLEILKMYVNAQNNKYKKSVYSGIKGEMK